MHCLAKTKSTVFQVAIRNNFHIDAIFVMGTLHTWIICLVDKNLGTQAALPRIVQVQDRCRNKNAVIDVSYRL